MYRLGFDIGGTNIAYGLLDENFRLIAKEIVPFPRMANGKPENAEAVAILMRECAYGICVKTSIPFNEIEFAGVCIPGSLDTSGRTVINAHNIGFHGVPFAEMTQNTMGMRVLMRNDADAAALAEHRLGALRGASCAVLVTLGTGVGGGIILGGRPFRGGMGHGIELGHMHLRGAEVCTCGGTGCVETLCSAEWLKKRALRLHDAGNGALRSLGSPVDARALIECVRLGDTACTEVWNEYTSNLSDALASIINILDPEIIALGGGVSGAGELLIGPVSQMAVERCFFDNAARIVRAELGNDAGLMGAVMEA